jgi:protein SCO1/2
MSARALRTVRIAAWLAIGVIAGFLVWTYLAPRAQNPTTPLVAATIGGPFSLTDQHGDTVTEASLKGHPSALFFGYTFCPDVCPTTLADLSVWLQQLGAYGDRLHVYFVTVDPARDTQAVLADYLQAFDPRIVGLTGSQSAVDQIVKEYRVYVNKVPGQAGSDGYTVDHTASVLLLDDNAKLVGTITYEEDPVVAYEKIRRLVGIAVS